MRTNFTFPDDENGAVLRNMQEDGDDLSKPRDIEFFFVFENERAARSFTDQARQKAQIKAEASFSEDREIWQSCAVAHMLPTHQGISNLERDLIEIARVFQGTPEGWGCMQVD